MLLPTKDIFEPFFTTNRMGWAWDWRSRARLLTDIRAENNAGGGAALYIRLRSPSLKVDLRQFGPVAQGNLPMGLTNKIEQALLVKI
jgi:hypothetical protein